MKEVELLDVDGTVKYKIMGYVSHAQRKAVWASKKDGGKGNPNSPAKMSKTGKQTMDARRKRNEAKPKTQYVDARRKRNEASGPLTIEGSKKVSKEKSMKQSGSPFKLKPKSPLMGKISASCKARAKKKFKVWPSAYASGWGVRCTQGKV